MGGPKCVEAAMYIPKPSAHPTAMFGHHWSEAAVERHSAVKMSTAGRAWVGAIRMASAVPQEP